jgi:hypothetical protein
MGVLCHQQRSLRHNPIAWGVQWMSQIVNVVSQIILDKRVSCCQAREA